MKIWISASAMLATLVAPVHPQGQSIADHPRVAEASALLATWAEAQLQYEEIPGASMAVVYDQELLWSKSFGYAHPELDVRATPETLYSICSISKLFTSVAVMQLREAGRLRLDDPVGQHLKWFEIEDTYPEAAPATIEGILTHSSGLPRESDYPYWTGPDFDFPTREDVIRRIEAQQELYPAETYFQYSNLGLTLAGEVVAAASGESYDAYIEKHILEPLGMAHTYSSIPWEERGGRMATGHSALTRKGIREPVPLFKPNAVAPAMGFASTAEDLARFASWQFRVLHHGSHEVLGPNALRSMHRVHWVDPDWQTTWGLGFWVGRVGDETFVGHGGSCPGFRSQLLMHPRDRVATVFMANASGVDSRKFAQAAYDIMSPAIHAAQEPEEDKAKVADAGLTRYVGAYSAWPWGGETAVVSWKGSLAMVSLPTDDPMENLVELRHTGKNAFRRVRDDGELGEPVTFDVDDDGLVTRMWQHSNYEKRIR